MMKSFKSPRVEIRNPGFDLGKVKALVFDLDDTLYFIPSGGHFQRYGEYLADFLPAELKKKYLEELERAWEERSPLKVGRAFDPTSGWVLDFDDDWNVARGYDLDGTPVPEKQLRRHYPPETKVEDLHDAIHLASGWGIPTALARFKGLRREHYREAYLATRSDMKESPETFALVFPPELPGFFRRLHDKKYKLIVATNSDSEDAGHVMEHLKIRSYFDKIYGMARKPSNSNSLFGDILQSFGLDFPELLVIGDSVYNDLRFAKARGSQTVLIERFAGQPLGMVDVRVWDFEGFIELWRENKESAAL